jgi:hypothetical protein
VAGLAVAAGAVIGSAPQPAGSPVALRTVRAELVEGSVGPIASDRLSCPMIVADKIGVDAFDAFDDVHKRMLINLTEATPGDVIAPCFVPGTDDAVIAAFEAVFDRLSPDRYNQTNRWSGNVASGPAGSFGEPITLTYSYAPDGTVVPNGIGEGQSNSNLYAFLNGIYAGNPATWQALYDQVFDRWEEVSGLNYVYEPNDDGATMFNNAGVLGVRGDLRMAGKTIDGNSNVLAYNFFPQNGDMVIDTADNFYFSTTNNSRRLRNVLAHEHGHGMGQLHVCPIQTTKLMEPTVTTSYDGPRHDDIRNAQRFYGDVNEPDNSAGAATDLGVVSVPSVQTIGTVPAPSVPFGSLLSIDANGEQDFFRFSVGGPAVATVTVTPIGTTYTDDSQSCGGAPASCCSTATTNSLEQANLALEILDADGTTVLATAAAGALGLAETVADLGLGSAGDYYIRVYETATVVESQLYTLTVTLAGVPTGACCNAGLCSVLTEDECLVLGGEYQGDGTDCGSVSCIPVGACCFSCIEPIVGPCPSPVSLGASCVELEEAECVALNGLYRGDDTVCADSPAPCQCPGDLNGDGSCNASDFTILAGQFGQGDPDCRTRSQGDLNCDGVVNASDFTILAGNFGCAPI